MSKLTFIQSKELLISILKSKGWEVSTYLKIPWAKNKELNRKYWFKPQAIYSGSYTDSFKDVLSTWHNHKEILKNEDLLNKLIVGKL